MTLFRDMEAIVMAAFGVLCALAIAASPPPPRVAASAAAAAPAASPMPVVVITGKRLTAAEKRALA